MKLMMIESYLRSPKIMILMNKYFMCVFFVHSYFSLVIML